MNAGPRISRTILIVGSLFLAVQALAAEGQPEMAGPIESFGETKTLRIHDAPGSIARLTYYEINGKAVIEGDIVLGGAEEIALIDLLAGTDFEALEAADDKKAQQLGQQGVGERLLRQVAPRAVAIKAMYGGRARRWPNGEIPYELAPGLPNPDRVRQAMEMWTASGVPIKFIPVTPANVGSYPRRLSFVGAAGGICLSSVGMLGGVQEITIDADCDLGNVVHEIGHAIGLQHEQTRSDRDKYVEVHYDNIIPKMKGNFAINTKQNDDIVHYDFGSIMHYPSRGFAIDASKDTLTPKASGISIGQRQRLSVGDIAAVKELYK